MDNLEKKAIILTALSRHTIHNPIKRIYLLKSIRPLTGLNDRSMRKIIAEQCPMIGECSGGYYWKTTTAECIDHEQKLKKDMQANIRRFKRCVEYRLDLQHKPREVSDVVKHWHVWNEPKTGIECPEYLRHV